jgi:hypothetical protein
VARLISNGSYYQFPRLNHRPALLDTAAAAGRRPNCSKGSGGRFSITLEPIAVIHPPAVWNRHPASRHVRSGERLHLFSIKR